MTSRADKNDVQIIHQNYGDAVNQYKSLGK